MGSIPVGRINSDFLFPSIPASPPGGGGGGGGGDSRFRVAGRSNSGKNQNKETSLGLPKKPPKKSHAEFPSLKNFQRGLNDTCITQ